MGEGPWLAGSVLSLADLHAAPMLQSFAWRRRPNNFLAGRIASSEVGPRERASELCADPSAAAPRVTALIVGAVLRIRCSDAATAGRERKPKSRYGEMSPRTGFITLDGHRLSSLYRVMILGLKSSWFKYSGKHEGSLASCSARRAVPGRGCARRASGRWIIPRISCPLPAG
jgi:hypothetical protein